MAFWFIALILFAASTVIMSFLRPKLNQEQRKPAGLGDFNFPTATEARSIPIIRGKILQRAPNCLWYGDLKTAPIKKKVANPATFGITKKTVITGYRYYVGMDLGLAHGAGVHLREILIDDKSVWTGDITGGSSSFAKPDLFGGDEKEGGYSATFDFYQGLDVESANAYLDGVLAGTIVPAYNGISRVVWRGGSQTSGYVGTTTNLRPFSFVLSCNPQPNVAFDAAKATISNGDYNPAFWAYEVLTDPDFGGSEPPELIDIPSFVAASVTLFNEGMGLSIQWDSPRPMKDELNDISKLIDGVIYVDRTTGLWTMKLIRFDYDPNALQEFNEGNVTEFVAYSGNTLNEAANKIIVNYVDKGNGYKERPMDFKNLAARTLQGEEIVSPTSFHGVSDATLAAKLAFREGKAYSATLSTATVKLDRRGHWIRPGSVFKLRRRDDTGTKELIPLTVMRAVKVDDGNYYDGEIVIDCVQDIFSLGNNFYTPPAATGWTPPVTGAVAVTLAELIEQPYFLAKDAVRIMSYAARPAGQAFDFDLWTSDDGGLNYFERETEIAFCPTATLVNTYSGSTAAIDNGTTLIISGQDLSELVGATASEVANGATFFRFSDTGEISAFQTITDNGNGTYTLSGVWRGLLDTVPADHAAGARIYFFASGFSAPADVYGSTATVRAKHLTRTLSGKLLLASATAFVATLTNRAARPLPPGNFAIADTSTAPGGVPSGQVRVTWAHRNRTTQTTVVKQSDPDITPEVGTTYTVRIYGQAGALLRTYTGVAGTLQDYTAAQELTDTGLTVLQTSLRIEVEAVRDGLTSHQTQKRTITRP